MCCSCSRYTHYIALSLSLVLSHWEFSVLHVLRIIIMVRSLVALIKFRLIVRWVVGWSIWDRDRRVPLQILYTGWYSACSCICPDNRPSRLGDWLSPGHNVCQHWFADPRAASNLFAFKALLPVPDNSHGQHTQEHPATHNHYITREKDVIWLAMMPSSSPIVLLSGTEDKWLRNYLFNSVIYLEAAYWVS